MEQKLILRAERSAAAAMLCRAAEPDAALLYLYITVSGDSCFLSKAARDLNMTEKHISKAANTLLLYGIVSAEGALPPRKETVSDPAELAALRDGDPAFSGLCNYMEGSLGRILRKSELEVLCTVHFDLQIPCDVLMLMINYCRSKRRLSVREIEKLSYSWSDNGITTYDRAIEYLEELKYKSGKTAEIMNTLGLFNRRPSDSERAFIEKWLSMGFDCDMIKLAYERMMARTHELSFPYLNAILERWHKEGISDTFKAQTDKAKTVHKTAIDDSAAEAAVIAAYEKRRHDRELRQQKRLEALIKKSPEFEHLERQIRLCSSQAARVTGDKRKAILSQRTQLVAERTRVLTGFSLPADWLDNIPDCPHCKDRGFIGTEKCECFKKAVAEYKKTAGC